MTIGLIFGAGDDDAVINRISNDLELSTYQ